MKKLLWKKILCILDNIEIQGMDSNTLLQAITSELDKNHNPYEKQDIISLIPYMLKLHFLKDTTRGLDLSPCATIFAKAEANSKLEALALFECYYQTPAYQQAWHHILHHPIQPKELCNFFDPFCCSMLKQTSLFLQEEQIRIRKEYVSDLLSIVEEYQKERKTPLLLSSILCACYTSYIVAHTNEKIEYKNTDSSIVSYPYLSNITKMIPRMGVPCDRGETKALQSFYKDTLFHECNHACCICQIDIAQLLIASHIKPFRDCAHIYEAIDHNNGLLLCRNHDFLFDQGYLSFADDGTILIAPALMKKENLTNYQINSHTKLLDFLLTEERRLFLAYHRHFIWKG